MQSSIIGKIEKAKRYAQEPERVTLSQFSVDFRGEHNSYVVSLKDGRWSCSCQFFSQRGFCSHTMALQRLFAGMLPEEAIKSASVGLSE